MTTATDEIKITDPSIITAIAPGTLRVIKRSGQVAAFDCSRIETAMKKAFLAVENAPAASQRVQDMAHKLAQDIEQTLMQRWPDGATLHIESIQDQVELALMRAGEQQVARSYVLYREQRRVSRAEQQAKATETTAIADPADAIGVDVTYPDGTTGPLSRKMLEQRLTEACADLDGVSSSAILEDTIRNLYSGISLKDVYASLVMCARTAVETEPNYSFVTARLLLKNIYEEGLDYLDVAYNWQENNISN